MELIIDVFNYALTAILIGVCGAWIFLIKSMTDSFRFTPYLDKFDNTSKSYPKVSIILPARNEEGLLKLWDMTLRYYQRRNREINSWN